MLDTFVAARAAVLVRWMIGRGEYRRCGETRAWVGRTFERMKIWLRR